ncbi:zinc-binding dehydrogenase [Streptomyces sp. GbtcB7]|uniref:zinc-binding dehydrogenase n=1 Tax=Streptomyces sp. GbtcB7 TaxID=2824752 RepID=UPI001C30C9EE|nr:zinc-binding dehydrogenase [Streptomyces sp. GbtcB7]
MRPGAVGMAAILAAQVAGCTTVIAVDRDESRLAPASELGATHTVLAGQEPLPPQIHAVVRGGVNYGIEATGVPAVAHAASSDLRHRARLRILARCPSNGGPRRCVSPRRGVLRTAIPASAVRTPRVRASLRRRRVRRPHLFRGKVRTHARVHQTRATPVPRGFGKSVRAPACAA